MCHTTIHIHIVFYRYVIIHIRVYIGVHLILGVVFDIVIIVNRSAY